MKAADLMTRKIVTTAPDASVEEAVRLMLRHRVSGLPVVDGAGAVVGMLTEGDLLRRAETGTNTQHSRWMELLMSPGRLAEEYVRSHARKVGEVMTGEVVTVEADAPLGEVVALMESRRIKRLPVLEKGRLVGIVSRADLLAALADMLPKAAGGPESDAELRRRVLAAIDKQAWAPRTSIDAKVQGGVVELRGTITDERERAALCVVAENVPGVTAVRDRLTWFEPMSGMIIEMTQGTEAPSRPRAG